MKCIMILDSGKVNFLDKREPVLKKGWAKIKVKYAGLCGSDLTKIFSDKKSRLLINKKVWGHEFSGVIEEIEKNFRFKKGDRVVIQPLIFTQKNEITRAKSLGKQYDGGFSEYVLVPIKNLLKVPKEISLELSALTEPLAVCIHALNFGRVEEKSKVLVIGDGSIGILISLLLKNKCKEIWIKGKNLENLKLASKLGIKIFDSKRKNKNYYTHIFETVGRKQDTTLNKAINFISQKGKIVVLGVFQKNYLNKLLLRNLFFKEASIVGSNCYEGMNDFEKALKFIKKNRDDLQNIITHKVRLNDFEKALKIAKNKRNQAVIKIMIIP